MKSVKRKLKSVKEIKREKSMSTSNLTTRSSLKHPNIPRKPLFTTVSTTNIAEVENENDAEYSSSSTLFINASFFLCCRQTKRERQERHKN